MFTLDNLTEIKEIAVSSENHIAVELYQKITEILQEISLSVSLLQQNHSQATLRIETEILSHTLEELQRKSWELYANGRGYDNI